MARSNPAREQLHVIRQSLATMERALTRLTASLNGNLASGAAPRRIKLSPKRRAALKLHGRYLGHIRQLKPRQKTKVKAMKMEKGYHAAIALAKRLARS